MDSRLGLMPVMAQEHDKTALKKPMGIFDKNTKSAFWSQLRLQRRSPTRFP